MKLPKLLQEQVWHNKDLTLSLLKGSAGLNFTALYWQCSKGQKTYKQNHLFQKLQNHKKIKMKHL
jgi:hypothetical protein